MMSSTPFKVLAALTGIVIAGEALALAVGMHILSLNNLKLIGLLVVAAGVVGLSTGR
jgi:uncharacterized protein YjeT (DUF2065 family)